MRLLFDKTKVVGVETIASPKPKKGALEKWGSWEISLGISGKPIENHDFSWHVNEVCPGRLNEMLNGMLMGCY